MGELDKLEQEAKAIYTFGKSHIVLTIALAAALFFGIYTFDSRRAERADSKAAIAEANAKAADQRANQADAANKQFQADAIIKENAANQRYLQLQQEVDSMAKAMVARDLGLKNQQATDATLPPTQLAARWQDLIHVPNSIGVTANGYTANATAAVATVQMLDSVPVLKQDVADLKSTVVIKDQQIATKDSIITLKVAEKGSDAAACDAKLAAKDLDIKAKQAEIDRVNANARKKGFKYMITGGIIVEIFHIWATGRP